MKKLDIKLKRKAEELFHSGVPITQISQELGINLNTLKNWAYKKRGNHLPWASKEITEEISEITSSIEELEDMGVDSAKSKSLEILIRSINVMYMEKAVVSLGDMQKLVKIIDTLEEYSKEPEVTEKEDKSSLKSDGYISVDNILKDLELHKEDK